MSSRAMENDATAKNVVVDSHIIIRFTSIFPENILARGPTDPCNCCCATRAQEEN